MSLRARLLVAFLALALVPLATMGWFTFDRLERSLALWNTPGVEQALQSALEVSKTSLVRLEAGVRAQAEGWAEAIPEARLEPERRPAVAAALPATSLDFLQLYRLEDGRWRLVDEVVPPGVLAPPTVDVSDRVAEALAGDRVLRAPEGALAGVWPAGPTGAVAVGYRVPPDFFGGVERVGEGVGFYRRFGVLRDVSRVALLVLAGTLVLILTAAAYFVSSRLARGMTRPVQELQGAVGRVASGDLEARVTPGGAHEFQSLGISFNRMTEQLAGARARLIEAEREAAWREVARRLAHEFKNLITPMGLSLHRLRRRVDTVAPEERAVVTDSLDGIDDGVQQLARLAEQFSHYARLPEPRVEAVDLADVVRSAVRRRDTEHVSLTVDAPPRLPARGDPLLLSRAIDNLVLNACEASPPAATVEVRVSVRGDAAVIEVLDRGAGLEPAIRDRLFEPYVSSRRRGSGLGLSLVRDVAVQHGGRVTLVDREGGGAHATFEIPLTRGPAPGTEANEVVTT